MRLQLSLPLKLLPCLLFGALLPPTVVAQTMQTNEYIYIGVEAEDHTQKDDRWVTTTPSTPTFENDPDGNHSDQASGSTYLELLPDMRVTHEDTFGPPTAYWGRGGQGPDAHYQVSFPEPGRYYVHVRAYSTGTEDNGIHVGIDGTWPDSGQRMQFCSASRRAWWWGSAQRDAGGNGSCGTEKTVWLDVEMAGMHTVSFSAREDGFEFDRFALIKDLSDNTRICSPKNISEVSCRNGSIESSDGFVDLRVRLSAEEVGADPDVEPPNQLEIMKGGDITLTAKIENLDAFDTATDIVLNLLPVVGDWQTSTTDSRCIEEGSGFTCSLNQLHPTAPNEYESFTFTMRATNDGNLRIDAAVLGAEADETPGNDTAATIVNVLPASDPSDLKLVMNTDKSNYETGDAVQLSATVSNVGQFAANDVSLSVSVPSGLEIKPNSLPAGCSSGAELECSFASINPAGSKVVNVEMEVLDAGQHTLDGIVDAINDDNETNNNETISVSSTTPAEETTTEGSAESGEVTGGSSDGNTGTSTTDSVDATTSDPDASDGTGGVTAGSTDGTTGGATDDTGDSAGVATAGSEAAGTTDGDDAGDTTTGGVTAGATDGAVDTTTAGETSGSSDGSADSATSGVNAGNTDGSVNATSGGSTSSAQQPATDDSGSMTHWFVLVLLLLCSARLYGRHERQRVTVC